MAQKQQKKAVMRTYDARALKAVHRRLASR